MKRILLTVLSALLLVGAKAQQSNALKPMRQRLTELNSITDAKTLENRLKELQDGEDEENYLLAYNYYATKGIAEQAGKAQKIILEKFPEGKLALQQKVQQIAELSDLSEQDKSFSELYRKYPNANYGFLTYSLSEAFAKKGDDAKMKYYAGIYAQASTDEKGNPIKNEAVYAIVARSMVEVKPDLAASYIKYGVDAAKESLDEMKALENPEENLMMRAQHNYFNILTSYIYALANGSNAEDGYQQAYQAYNALQNDKKVDSRIVKLIESVYIQTLLNTKRYKEALPFMETAIKEDNATKAIKDNLKVAYIAVYGSETGFQHYQTNLLDAQEKNLQAEIAKIAINMPAPNFELKDVEGKTIKLSDLKGKVVVLDFWATWCGPCKASFPAMQKALDKYKDDTNVKFLFLHTWEKGTGDATQNAKKYVTDNNYAFEVLMDLRDTATKVSAVAAAYKVDGIPAKFIIDTKGQIRFNTSGFGADADKAVKELSNMIEFAKKG